MIFSKPTPPVNVLLTLTVLLFTLLIVPVAALAQQSTGKPVTPLKRKARVAKKVAPEPPAPPAPLPPPPTREQMPALPPQVHYSRGQLTIVADNSILADILKAVRTQTGAVIEVPPSATERVVGHFGPGPARDVLAALLNGAHFNYVMVGSPAHPDSVDRLILTSKAGAAPEPPPPAAPPASNNEAPMDEASAPSPEPEPPAEETPEDATNGENPPPSPEGQQQVKTPEQLLRELQQQQLLQQQLQQQEQQGQPPNAPPPN